MILDDFNKLKPDMQGRNIAAWTPVVAEVLQGFSIFDDTIVSQADFERLQFSHSFPVYSLSSSVVPIDLRPTTKRHLSGDSYSPPICPPSSKPLLDYPSCS